MTTTVPAELAQAVKEHRCALFVGAGLSRGSGYPDWLALLDRLIGRAAEHGVLPEGAEDELRNHLKDDHDFLLVAEELRDQMGEGLFRDELANVFLEDKPAGSVHEKLHRVGASCIITTNYDKLIENAYASVFRKAPPVYTYDKAGDVLDQLWRNNFFLLKAHGTVDERRSMVITRRDYRGLIYKADGYRSVLETVFNTKAVLFLGASLRDPELDMLLSYLHDAFEGSVQKHFALMPSSLTKTAARRWQKDYSVRCLTYTPTAGHPEVEQFLDQLVT